MVRFEIFVKAMPPSLSELKVLPSFCFPIKIRDDRTASIEYIYRCSNQAGQELLVFLGYPDATKKKDKLIKRLED